MNAPQPLSDFAGYRNQHYGATIIVCGCGPSLNLFEQSERHITIGVNDVGRRFTRDYLVAVNGRRQFRDGRYEFVEQSCAKAVFTQLDEISAPHSRIIRFRQGQRSGTDGLAAGTLDYTNNSPYVAVNLARHFGAALSASSVSISAMIISSALVLPENPYHRLSSRQPFITVM